MQTLKDSELRYRRLFEAAQDGILILDAETGMIEDVNPYLIKILGYSREEFIKKKLWEVGAFKDIEASKDAFEALQENEYIRFEDLPLKTKDGRLIQVEFVSNVYLVGGEKVIQCDIRDITEHKRIIAALQENEKKYYDLVNQSPDGVFIMELSGNILTVNKAMSQELEYSEEEFLSMSIWDIIPQQYLDQYRKKLTKILAGESLEEPAEYAVRGKDGKIHYVEVLSAPRYSGKDIVGFQGIARDITKRKRAEAELLKLQKAVDNSGEVIFMTDRDGLITFVNPEFTSLYGYTAAEVVGKNTPRILKSGLAPPEDHVTLWQTILSKQVVKGEFVNKTKDGRLLNIEGSINPILDDGNIVGFLAIQGNITERKQVEKILRETREKIQRIFDSSPNAIYLIDLNGIVAECNETTVHLHGYSTKEELLGTNGFNLVVESERQRAMELLGELVSRGTMHNVELTMVRKDGSQFAAETAGNVLRDPSGKPSGLVVITTDITERKRAEEALHESEEQFRSTFEQAAVGMAQVAPDGRYLRFNQRLCDIVGYTREELLTKTFQNITHPDDLGNDVANLHRLLANEIQTYATEKRYIRKGGQNVWANLTVSLVREPTGAPKYFVSAIEDITNRKQAEEALRNREGMLQRIFDLLPVGLWFADKDGNLLRGNPAGVKIWGAEPKVGPFEYGIFKARRLPSGEEVAADDWALAHTIRDRVTIVDELLEIDAFDGKKKTILNYTAPVLDAQGNVQGAIVVNQDITERKQAEQEIANLAKFPSENPNPVLRLSRDGIVMYANAASDALLGMWGCGVGGSAPQFWRDLAVQMPANGENKTVDIECEGKVYSMFVTPVAEPGYMNLYGRDITERKQAELRIRRQVDYLTALQDIDRTIATAIDMSLSLNILISKAISLLAVDAAAVLLIDFAMNTLEFAAGDGFRTNSVRTPHIKLGESYAGRAVMEQRLVKIPNPKEQTDNLFLASIYKGEDFVGYYGLPLTVKGKVIGVLEVFQRSLIKRNQEWFDFLNALAGQAAIAISNAQLFDNLQHSNTELTQAYDATIEGWSRALDLRDKETEGHSKRVTEMTVKLARTFGLSEAELVQVRWGSLLHDIGKMGVPDNILLKPGALTDEEWVVMRKHPVFAYEMLAPIRYLRLALDIPYFHHEKWDGTGYPNGLEGIHIPLAARIFAVVDVWDALTSDRPYRPAWTEEKAREHIRASSGTHFDPQVVSVFMQMSD